MEVLYCIAALLITLFFIWKRQHKRNNNIPGPKDWPLIGYAPYMKKGKEHEIYSQLAKTYGDIFQINLFGQKIVVLNSSAYIRKAFCDDKYKRFMNDRSVTFYGKYLLDNVQSIAFAQRAYDSDHGELRKAFAKAMHVYGEGKQDFEDKVKDELSNLVRRTGRHGEKGFDVMAEFRRSLTNLMAVLLGGHALDDDDKDVDMFWEFDELNDFFLGADINLLMSSFPWLRFIPGKLRSSYLNIQQAMNKIIKRFINDKKDTFEVGKVRGFVDFFIGEQIKAINEGGHVLFSDTMIMAMALETIAAGILTTLGSLSSTILCLINYPEYQGKLQAELDTVVGRDRLPSLEDRPACVLLEAVSLEVQRYITIVPLSLPHLCEEGVNFEGYLIQPNTMIIPNIWYVHHNEGIWRDPWNFRPERWIGEDGNLLPNDHVLRKNWLAFGTGRRQCPGESLARSRIFLYVATLLQRWTFEAPPEHAVSCDPRLGHFSVDLNCRPKPYMCRVIPRSKD